LRLGQADQAVAYYRVAVQDDPDNAAYKIALERAMVTASREHIGRAQKFEEQDQLDAARSEYRLAAEYDPSNQTAAAKVTSLEQTIRARNEAARPPSPNDALRAQARAAAQPRRYRRSAIRDEHEPARHPVVSRRQSGVSIVYDRDALAHGQPGDERRPPRRDGRALRQLLTYNSYTYKVLSEQSI
jgi:tetratricopeptide (TPR) repeat protein